jgi:hypothetical protein
MTRRLARKSTKALTLAGTSLDVMTACTSIGGKLQSSSTRRTMPVSKAGRAIEGASGAMPYPCSMNLRVIETLLVESRPRTSTSTELSPEIRRQMAGCAGRMVGHPSPRQICW